MREATESENTEFRRRFYITGLVSLVIAGFIAFSAFVVATLFQPRVVAWYCVAVFCILYLLWLVFRRYYFRCSVCRQPMRLHSSVCKRCGTRFGLQTR